MYWMIFDAQANRKYIDVKYKSEKVATRELQDLLRPYPKNHEWRKRLFVKAVGSVVESSHADQKS
jgi:hypothetical protein